VGYKSNSVCQNRLLADIEIRKVQFFLVCVCVYRREAGTVLTDWYMER